MHKELEISSNNPTLTKVIKLFMYFSEIMPKKYSDDFKEIRNQQRINEGIVIRPKDDNYKSNQSTSWSQDYVQEVE